MPRLIVILLLTFPLLVSAQDQYLVDWDEVGEEAINHLVNLVRIDTSNPPGNETLAANYVKEALAADGIDSEMYALDPDRANLLARINGNGSKRPILIMGHTDVVGVQAERWDEEPFGGLRKDGWIYGRGTLDDKDNVAAGLMLMVMLKRYGVELDRDIIFLAESGEEGTPEVGINYMVEHHWDKIDAEFALAEGGTNTLEDSGITMVQIQTAEKMPRRATLIARGTAGHGSVPRVDNPVTALAKAVAKMGSWQTEARLNSTTRAYFERMAVMAENPEDAFRYANVENPDETEAIQQWFLENYPYHYSVMRTSVVPTIVDGGFRRNVIPSEARAVLDIRMLPDEDVNAFYDTMREMIDNPNVEVVPERIYRPESPPSPVDNEMFETLERVADRVYDNSRVVPRMATGATDMAQVRAKGVPSYGIGATRTIAEINSGNGAHGDNERVSEESVRQLVEYIWYTIIDIAATR
ncbi:MAG: M20/M25/M40 family metallo-hydrolase [Pseudomonadota bacterium]|nr:M20/M25/M40 family metallo-hydrolase [Pseudomonadota bacterium]